jgi:predicted nicotinamide N-methyase
VDATRFILEHTHILPVPSLSCLKLYQANEVTPLWQMTEMELQIGQIAPPFWAFAWAGGQALGQYIFDFPHIVKGRSVFDMASGSGVVAICAALQGALSITANDIDPFAEAAIGLNAALNGVSLRVETQDRLKGDVPEVDVILAGDICYDRNLRDAMLTFFGKARHKGIEVYVGDPHRTYFPETGFERLMTYEIKTQTEIEDSPIKRASVWRMQ